MRCSSQALRGAAGSLALRRSPWTAAEAIANVRFLLAQNGPVRGLHTNAQADSRVLDQLLRNNAPRHNLGSQVETLSGASVNCDAQTPITPFSTGIAYAQLPKSYSHGLVAIRDKEQSSSLSVVLKEVETGLKRGNIEIFVEKQNVEVILEYLRSQALYSEHCKTIIYNVDHVFRWMALRRRTSTATQAFLDYVLEIVHTMDVPIQVIRRGLRRLLVHDRSDSAISPITAFVDALGSATNTDMDELYVETMSVLLDQTLSRHERNAPGLTNAVDKWLHVLETAAKKPSRMAWNKIHASLLRLPEPSPAVIKHFARLSDTSLAWALLLSFEPRTQLTDATSRPDLNAQLRQIYNDREQSGGAEKPALNMLIELLALVQRHGSSHIDLLRTMFNVLMESRTAPQLQTFLTALWARPEIIVPTDVGVEMIQKFVDRHEPELGLNVFRNMPTIPLHSCMELALMCLRFGKTHPAMIVDMLRRKPRKDQNWDIDKDSTHPDFRQGYVELAGLLAYNFATSPHIRTRQAFRHVHQCFRFVQDRGLTPSNLLVRSLVLAAIDRPLNEKFGGSNVKAEYAIAQARKYLGDDVAERLKILIRQAWAKNALPSEVYERRRQILQNDENTKRLALRARGFDLAENEQIAATTERLRVSNIRERGSYNDGDHHSDMPAGEHAMSRAVESKTSSQFQRTSLNVTTRKCLSDERPKSKRVPQAGTFPRIRKIAGAVVRKMSTDKPRPVRRFLLLSRRPGARLRTKGVTIRLQGDEHLYPEWLPMSRHPRKNHRNPLRP